MKKVKSYLLKMSPEEKKSLDARAKEMGITLAAYLRMVSRLEMETKLKSTHGKKD